MQTRCDEVADALVAQGLHAVALHGGRTQGEREAALREFRKGTTNILVRPQLLERIDATCPLFISHFHFCLFMLV